MAPAVRENGAELMRWHGQWAWVDGRVAADVVVSTEDGVVTDVAIGVDPGPDVGRLTGMVYPGFANGHSHVFHRLVRGHTAAGDFWSWRDAMYEVAAGLDPDSLHQTSVAVFREMVAAGYTSVSEFHYVHHQPDGRPYDDPNVMSDAIAAAAVEVGIRLLLLDTCYLSAGFGAPPQGPQVRFSDGAAETWAARVSEWRPPEGVAVGAAIHSVRAVDPPAMEVVMTWAAGRPVHVHLSEQPAENEQCLAHLGRTPTRVLADAGVLGPNTTAIHATHLGDDDLAAIAATGTTVVMCPSTERWLADGIGPSAALVGVGVALGIGSDSQAVIDPFEEMRLLELHQRLATLATGAHPTPELIAAGVGPGGGGIAVGAPADLVAVDTTTARNAGVPPEGLVFSATTADVRSVIIGGAAVV